jgi:hypothetical protein
MMKKIFLALPIIGVLSACGSNGVNQQAQNDYKQQARAATQAIDEAPKWMYKLPKETGVIYENGTAISSDFSMADLKAKTMAYVKICTGAGGKVRSQMKMYRADNDAASLEQSELTVRSICPDVDITGVETVEMKHVAEGNRIRSYVLVALPMGSKNIMKSTKEIQNRSSDAFKELDGIVKEQPAASIVTPVAAPVAPILAAPVAAPAAPPTETSEKLPLKPTDSILSPVSAVSPKTVLVTASNGNEKQVTLIGSTNPEYVAKRAEALKKPGAVIGQASIE